MILPERAKENRNETGGGLLLPFLARHGEKFVAGVLLLAAAGLALQALYYQPLSWPPEELTELADRTEELIKANEHIERDIQAAPFDYAGYAVQIRTPVPSAPYQSDTEWHPVLRPVPSPRSGFEVLAVQSLRGEAIRRSGLTTQGNNRWQRPPLPGTEPQNYAAIWVNLYATLPLQSQWEIYNRVFDNAESHRPEYVYYEWERAERKPNEEPMWQPVAAVSAGEIRADVHYDFSPERLIPFVRGAGQEPEERLLYTDFDVEPAKTYTYRVRLYLVNPNYKRQMTTVQEGVDTQNEFARSDWSFYTTVYVPDRTLVQLQSVTPTDPAEFPRQTAPLRSVRGAFSLEYFDMELGHSLPKVEKQDVLRGMLLNMPKEEANRYLNRNRSPGEAVNVNYPDIGLRSDVCVMDFSGGRPLQKRRTNLSQASPDLFVTGKVLLLMPNGTIQIQSTEPELFR